MSSTKLVTRREILACTERDGGALGRSMAARSATLVWSDGLPKVGRGGVPDSLFVKSGVSSSAYFYASTSS